jgi:Flp pilus assembly CpaF family ATPase
MNADANLYTDNPLIDRTVEGLLGLAEWLRDPSVQEISINGGRVYVDRGAGSMEDTGARVADTAIRAATRLLVAGSGGFLDPEAPFANLTLACGARFHAALMPVANDPQICIRGHSGMGRPLRAFGTADQIQIIADTIDARKTVIVGGPTSAGKSTLMNAMVDLIPAESRLVIIEDVFELKPDISRNIVRRLATTRADLKTHIYQSLRARPDWIVIGETRDHSARDLMDASRTGHPALSTIHASSARGILTRLMSLAGCDEQFVNEAIDLAIFVERFRDGQRRVTEIIAKRPDLTWKTV